MKIRSFLFIVFTITELFSQQSSESFEKLTFSPNISEKIPSENIYIQTDKEIYKSSETIWFKAYILNTKDLTPSIKNQTLYVQLSSVDDGSIVFEKKFEIINGFCNGDIHIEENIDLGKYNLSAYTASSVINNDFPIISYKSINIKRDIVDNIYMNFRYDKDLYLIEDSVKLNLNFYNNSGSGIANSKIIVNYLHNDKSVKREKLLTNEKGIINLDFNNDENIEITDLEFIVSNEGNKKTFQIEIPLKRESELNLGLFPEGGKLISGLVNKLAFKSLRKGVPVFVKGELLEDGIVVKTFNSIHDGMGYFNFIPRKNKTYRIRITEPKTQYFELPAIEKEGISFKFIRETDKELVFNIAKSKNINQEEFGLRIQAKSIVYRYSKFKQSDDMGVIRISKAELPKGVLEFTLFNSRSNPIAERLVFNRYDEVLQIDNSIVVKDIYKIKEKITLKFKTTDYIGNPKQTHLGVRVYDNVYSDPNNEKNIVTHYYLFSELKGNIYNPTFYFNKDSRSKRLLDLLMLTHGWRNYVYSKPNLEDIGLEGNIKIEDKVIASILEMSAKKVLRPISSPLNIKLIYPSAIVPVTVKKNGLFEVPLSTNRDVLIRTPTNKKYFVRTPNYFDKLNNILGLKKFKDNSLFSAQKANPDKDFLKKYLTLDNRLDEVIVNASKHRNVYVNNRGRKRIFPDQGDYVCEFDYLNCTFHPDGGFEPIEGIVYKLINGGSIIYKKPEQVNKNNFKNTTVGFGYVEGYEYKKEFYEVNYEKQKEELKNFVDTRTTLAWEPNLITDEKGIVEFSFFASDIKSSFTIHIEGVDNTGNIGSFKYTFKVR